MYALRVNCHFRLPSFAHSASQCTRAILRRFLHHEWNLYCHWCDHRMVYALRSITLHTGTHTSTDAHNLGSETKKATGIPMFMAIGQCGSILGSHIYPSTDGPRYMCVLSRLLPFVRTCSFTTFCTDVALLYHAVSRRLPRFAQWYCGCHTRTRTQDAMASMGHRTQMRQWIRAS